MRRHGIQTARHVNGRSATSREYSCGMVLYSADLVAGRQGHGQPALPAGRVFPLAPTVDLGVVQDGFDTAPHARRRLGLGRPYRRQNLQHIACRYVTDRTGAEDWMDVGGERAGPLCRVLAVPPPRPVGLDVLLGRCLERDGLCALTGLELTLILTVLLRISPRQPTQRAARRLCPERPEPVGRATLRALVRLRSPCACT
jgi:hypothetical protein